MSESGDALRLEIDEYQLDKEWLDQPKQYHRWAVKLSSARMDLDLAKSRLDVCKAELDNEIRNNPADRGVVGKITETVIASTIISQPEYSIAEKRVIEAKHSVGLIQAAVEALDQRRRALEGLVSLHVTGYFAEPRAPKGHEEEIREMEKANIRARMKVREQE